MKTKILALALVLFTVAFSACSKDDSSSSTSTNPVTDGFKWTENGGTTVNTAASATFSTQYKTLMAKDAAGATIFEINLNGTTPATYAIDPTNAITYTGVTPFFIVDSGNVIVTANASSKMSGTFQGTGTASGGITALSGTFTNITVIP
ncbi:hypothetical protein [Flavobacterium sp.]|uniref:hypothetical protein n=1 Tax=Flavobacterium sp. TaxID=239 RepID=UPI00286B13F9|nr:hypothetical protein [Flavobacterium sp.]